MNFKYLALTAMLGLALTGCNSLPGTSTALPAELKQQLVTDKPIVAYFANSDDAEYSTEPTEDGYYRVLLGRDDKGRYLVQDYFQATNKIQSSPFWLDDSEYLRNFAAPGTEGIMYSYFKSGELSTSSKFSSDDENHPTHSFYRSGKQAIEFTLTDEDSSTYDIKYWYENGKLAVDGKMSYPEDDAVYDAKAWDEQGKPVSGNAAITQIVESIHDKISDE